VIEACLRDVVLRSFPKLPYDQAAATWHGQEQVRLEALGKPAPFVDGQIAAVAHVRTGAATSQQPWRFYASRLCSRIVSFSASAK
jgi:predicted nucleic acid-binding protein